MPTITWLDENVADSDVVSQRKWENSDVDTNQKGTILKETKYKNMELDKNTTITKRNKKRVRFACYDGRDLTPIRRLIQGHDLNIGEEFWFVFGYIADTMIRVFLSLVMMIIIIVVMIKMLLSVKDDDCKDEQDDGNQTDGHRPSMNDKWFSKNLQKPLKSSCKCMCMLLLKFMWC